MTDPFSGGKVNNVKRKDKKEKEKKPEAFQ